MIGLRNVAIGPRQDATVTSYTNNTPSGALATDYLVWFLEANSANTATATGWTAIASGTTTALGLTVLARFHDGSSSSYTTGTLTAARWSGAMIALTGVNATTQLDVASPTGVAGTTAVACPAITPVTAGAWVLGIGAMQSSSLTNPASAAGWSSSNLNLDADNFAPTTSTTGSGAWGVLGHALWSSGGFTPSISKTLTSARSYGLSVAIRPAPDARPRNIQVSNPALTRSFTW